MKSLKLRTKILLALLCSSVIPIILVCIVLGVKIKNNSLEDFFTSTSNELSHVEKAISIFIDETKSNTSFLARHPASLAADESFQSYINETVDKSRNAVLSDAEQRVIDLIAPQLTTHKSYVDVYVGTEFGGFSMASGSPLPPGYDPRKRPWYQIALSQKRTPLISKAYQSTTGDVVITATESIERGNTTVGVVGIDVTLAELTDFVSSIKLGKSGYVILVQDDGVILADPKNPDFNFTSLTDTQVPAFKELDQVSSGSRLVEIDDTEYAVQVHTTKMLGWKLIGLIEKSEIMAEVYSMLRLIFAIGLVIAVAFIIIGVFLARSLSRPIITTTQMIKDIAEGEGDLTKRLEITTKDELGTLAMWFNHFLDNLQKIIQELASHSTVVDSSSTKLLGIATQVSTNAGEASNKANMVTRSSSEMSDNMTNVASRMEDTTHNTTMVAAAVEEMAATINEIAQNSEKARTISDTAVSQAVQASSKVNALGEAATAISAVTETITEISEQTNLLALNATIEAARAGDSGKGFAVVANEIKELAKQTAEATSEIKSKIESVQGTTSETVAEIASVGEVINDINDIISTIATAIEEQSAATSEISSNIGQASQGIEDVNRNISEGTSVINEISTDVALVNDSAHEISSNSNNIELNANELKQLAEELNHIIRRFKF